MPLIRGSNHNRLSDLLNSVIDFSAQSTTTQEASVEHNATAADEREEQHLMQSEERPTNRGRDRSQRAGNSGGMGLGGVITTLVSAIALIFSGYSFYETVLKQPKITLYPPALVHLYRQDYKDILAFPVTLSNDGAQRGTILSFDMEVTNPATGEKRNFENLYFGNDPRDTSRIFTPLTLAGRSSKGEVVMFFATKTGAFFETTGGVPLTLNIAMKVNLDKSDYIHKKQPDPELKFSVSTNFIRSFRDMEQGRPTVLRRSE